MSSRTAFRASVESALTDRLQDLVSHVTGPSNAALMEQFELDMAYLRGLAPEYARRFNHFHSPLLRLPSEILPLILGAATSDTRYQLRGWISLGHICHDLRAALLSMHALWADVVFDTRYARAQEELLRRAGCSPIAIQLEYSTPSWSHDKALELLPRARTINAHDLSRARMKAIVGTLIERTCTYLEELSLTIHLRECQVVPGPILLSQDASELATPKLRDVHFRNVFIPVDMSSIKTLTLDWMDTNPQPVHDFCTFAAMLRCCRKLETLHLNHWFPTDWRGASHIVPHQAECKISLPHLGLFVLSIGNDPQDITTFFAFWDILDIPQTTTVHLDFTDIEFHSLDHLLVFTRSFHPLISHTQIAGTSQISQIRVSGDDSGIVELTLCSADKGSQPDPFAGLSMSSFTISWPWESITSPSLKIDVASVWETPNDLVGFLQCICATLQLRVDDFDIVDFEIRDWCFLPEPEHCHIDEHLLYTMFSSVSCLYLDVSADIGRILGSGTPQGICLPNLRTLHSKRYPSQLTFSLADIEHLIDAIKKRIDQGRPLQVLYLEGAFSESDFGTGVKERCLKQLTALVPHFRFNELDVS